MENEKKGQTLEWKRVQEREECSYDGKENNRKDTIKTRMKHNNSDRIENAQKEQAQALKKRMEEITKKGQSVAKIYII